MRKLKKPYILYIINKNKNFVNVHRESDIEKIVNSLVMRLLNVTDIVYDSETSIFMRFPNNVKKEYFVENVKNEEGMIITVYEVPFCHDLMQYSKVPAISFFIKNPISQEVLNEKTKS